MKKNYFKISYIESILLIIGFIVLNFFNIFFRNILKSIKIPENTIFSLSYAIPFIILFSIVFLYIKKKKLSINLSIKFSPWYTYIVIFLMMLCTMVINEYASLLVPKNGPILENMYEEIDNFLKEEIKNPIPFLSTTVLLAPICEEVFFRGLILNGLLKNKKIHPISAIVFSSFLFGLTHMNPWQFVGGFLIGAFIGYVYFITSSIINCILLHMFNNGIAIFGMFCLSNKILFYEKYIERSTTNKYSHWIIFFIVLTILISGALFLFEMNKKKDNISDISE